MKIYLARPISGCSYDEVVEYYSKMHKDLWYPYVIFSPMSGKEELRTETRFKANGYEGVPVATNHAIIERDRWMVNQADIILVYLIGTKEVSIGCMMELAWAHQLGKHSIVVMEPGNIHEHAFVLEAADIVYHTLDEAIDYLNNLVGGME